MEGSPMTTPEGREVLRGLSRFWWLWLAFGIGWVVIALVILQFDQASITTVGILIGLIESLGGHFIAVRWTDVIIFSILVLVLVFRPTGLLGRAAPTKS